MCGSGLLANVQEAKHRSCFEEGQCVSAALIRTTSCEANEHTTARPIHDLQGAAGPEVADHLMHMHALLPTAQKRKTPT